MTDENRSSSNRAGGVCDAVLTRNEHPVGPMRLPISRADDFIDQFNRVYAGVGMKLAPIEPAEDAESAESP